MSFESPFFQKPILLDETLPERAEKQRAIDKFDRAFAMTNSALPIDPQQIEYLASHSQRNTFVRVARIAQNSLRQKAERSLTAGTVHRQLRKAAGYLTRYYDSLYPHLITDAPGRQLAVEMLRDEANTLAVAAKRLYDGQQAATLFAQAQHIRQDTLQQLEQQNPKDPQAALIGIEILLRSSKLNPDQFQELYRRFKTLDPDNSHRVATIASQIIATCNHSGFQAAPTVKEAMGTYQRILVHHPEYAFMQPKEIDKRKKEPERSRRLRQQASEIVKPSQLKSLYITLSTRRPRNITNPTA